MIGKQFVQNQIKKVGETPQPYIRVVIIIAVLLVSLAVSVMRNSEMLLLLPLAVVGIAVVIILMRSPALGIVGLIVASMLIPSPFGSGQLGRIGPAMILEGLLLGLWVLDMVVKKRSIQLAPSRTNLPLMLFLLVALISLINGQINYYFVTPLAEPLVQVVAISLFFLSAGAYLLAGNLFKDLVWIERMTWLFLLLSSFYILGRLVPQIETYVYRIYQYGSDVSTFWIWLVSLVSSQLLLNKSLAPRWKLALGALLAGTLYIALIEAYTWKSGWLPAMAGLAVVVFVGLPRFRGVAIFMAVIVGVLGFTQIGDLVAGGEDYSISTRYEAWKLVLTIAKANPILGLGPANYYWYTPLFPILGYAVNYNSHNNYIDLFAQTGIIGLGMFLWFAVEVGVLGWKLKDTVPDGFAKAFVIGALGGLAGTLVTGMLGDWFLPFYYNVGLHGYRSSIYSWLFLGCLLAIEQIYRKKSPASVESWRT